MKKTSIQILTEIFAWGITICFLFAFLIDLCYVLAFFIGGNFAMNFCSFLTNRVLPPAYITAGLLSIVGIIKMYLNGEKVFLIDLSQKDTDALNS